MAKDNLPATLYVKYERDGDSGYFVADPNAYDLANAGDKIKVGTYKLIAVSEVEMQMKARKIR